MPTTTVTEQGEEVPNLDQAQYALNEAAVILMRLGGVISIGPKRIDIPAQGRYGPRQETEFLVFRWQSFSPIQPKEVATPAEGTTE